MDRRKAVELERLAISLYKLEEQLNHAIKIHDQSVVIRLILECLLIQEKIREKLADSPILNIANPIASNVIRNVRDKKGLTSMVLPELMPVLLRLLGVEAQAESRTSSPQEYSLPREYNDWIQELLGYIDLEMFIEARKQVGTLIVGRSIPKALEVYFREIKDCYIFGQGLAAAGLCRVLLEIALRDVHHRRGTHKTEKGKDLQEWGISKLVQEATFLPRELKDLAMAIIDESSKILHGKPKHERPISLIRKTFPVVEKLYSS